jgi:hypothetical protein
MQPTLTDFTTDERGRFPMYGDVSFLVHYSRHKHCFFEVCEAVWAHWMRVQQEHPELDRDRIFYWIDIFALSQNQLAKPVSQFAEGGQLEAVRNCSS